MRVAASSPAWLTRSCVCLVSGLVCFWNALVNEKNAIGLNHTAEERKSRCSWVRGLSFFFGDSVLGFSEDGGVVARRTALVERGREGAWRRRLLRPVACLARHRVDDIVQLGAEQTANLMARNGRYY